MVKRRAMIVSYENLMVKRRAMIVSYENLLEKCGIQV
jgi:hypothetical protein